jgi:hypothetical protein
MRVFLSALVRYALTRGAKGAGAWYVVVGVLGLLGAAVRWLAPRATKR